MSRRSARVRWEPIVEKFNNSGKSARHWAEEEGISYPSLIHWIAKLKETPAFVELNGSVGTFELRWRGIRIELSSFEELKELGQLLVQRC